MNVWIVFVGETLPMDKSTRMWRYSILAETLAARGHHVTRWAPTFNHSHKKQRYNFDYTYKVNKNYKIKLIYNKRYTRNVSFQRLFSYIKLAHSFKKRIKNEQSPDIIISGMPTPWLCSVVMRYVKHKNIPVIIDIRDLWPDIFVNIFPNKFRFLAKVFIFPLFIANKNIFRKATAIYGISKSYLQWGLNHTIGYRSKGNDKIFPLGYKELSLSHKDEQSIKDKLKKMGVDPNKLICCFFGQLESTYDVETIVKTASILKSRGEQQVQFILCGQGSKMNSLLDLSKELDNLLLLGWVAPAILNVLMRISSIGLVSYAKNAPQTLPNKPFEYFSGGLPVLSSLRGELEQIMSDYDCGLTYEAGNIYELVEDILYLKNNPEKRVQMGKNARLLFEEKYQSDKIYPAMANHIEKIVKINDKEH